MILWAHNKFPVWVRYVDKLPLAGRMRIFILPYIEIQKFYKDDQGLHLHELQHVEDFYSNWTSYYLDYRNDQRSRLIYECRAYARQYLFDPNEALYEKLLAFLCDCYDLDMQKSEIKSVFDKFIEAAASK